MLSGLLLLAAAAYALVAVHGAVLPGSSTAPNGTRTAAPPRDPLPCQDILNVRVNVHFVQHDDGTGNFTASDNGRPGKPDPDLSGYEYAKCLIGVANEQMDRNPVLNLAPGSSLTPVAKRVRWVLDGVYFDKSSFYRDGALARGVGNDGTPYSSPSQDYASLCIKGDSVINIFLVEEVKWPYQPSSTNPRPPTGGPLDYTMSKLAKRGYVSYVADCPNSPPPPQLWAVIGSPWTNQMLYDYGCWAMSNALNHELCHLLGLNHPFEGLSGCADAPAHPNARPSVWPNCWNLNEPPGPDCDSISKVSNNLMDYNAAQEALSPCQVGIVQNNLNTCLRDRYVYRCSNCLPVTASFDMPASTCGRLTNIRLDGRASSWAVSSFKLEIDRLDAQKQPIARAHLDTTIAGNLGLRQLDALYSFSARARYRVKVTVYNNCGSAAVRVHTFTTATCQ